MRTYRTFMLAFRELPDGVRQQKQRPRSPLGASDLNPSPGGRICQITVPREVHRRGRVIPLQVKPLQGLKPPTGMSGRVIRQAEWYRGYRLIRLCSVELQRLFIF